MIFKNGINNLFSSQTSFLLVSNSMQAMPNRKTIESWDFNNLGYECNEFGETVIFCKTCCEYYSTNPIPSLSSTLINSQVYKFVSGTNVVKKATFPIIQKECFTFQCS